MLERLASRNVPVRAMLPLSKHARRAAQGIEAPLVKTSEGNPVANVIPAGMTEAAVLEAVNSSGFPLQVAVSRRLNAITNYPAVEVFEEWTFVDSDEHKERALDLVLELKLPFEPPDLTYGSIAMLIECKASKQPFVFFEAPLPYDLREQRVYPRIVGLKHSRVKLHVKTGVPPYVTIVPQQLVAVKDIAITASPSAHAHTYTKVIPDGKKLSASGAEAYNSIVLPLMKALRHYERIKQPAPGHSHFHAIAVFPVAIINGPIMYSPLDGSGLIMAPWIRLSKHELFESDVPVYRDSLAVIDFVHADYFERYLTDFILPFADQYAKRVKRQAPILATGEGVIPAFTYNDRFFYEASMPLHQP